MKIKKIIDFIKEDLDNIPDYMYHSTEPTNVNSILTNGLNGNIYLTLNPEDAQKYHPVVLKIYVKGKTLKVKDDGFVAQNIPPEDIEIF